MLKNIFSKSHSNKFEPSLSAFTIMELMVVSVLTVLTAAAAIQGIRLLQDFWVEYESSTEQEIQYQYFKQRLQSDFDQAQQIRIEDQTVYITQAMPSIAIKFAESAIYRIDLSKNNITDSLSQVRSNFQAQYKKEFIHSGIIDQLHLTIELGPASNLITRQYTLIKDYSAAQRLAHGTKY